MRDLWYWYQAGGFPQQWHFSQLEAHVEDILHNPAQLVCTGVEEPRADPVWTRSLLHLHLPQLISHLVSGEIRISAGGLSVGWGRGLNAMGGVCNMKEVERQVEVKMRQ